MPEEIQVQTLRTGGRIVVYLRGDAGTANVSRLEAELTNVAATHPSEVIVELTGLTFIASRAMGAIMGFHRRMTLQGGKVKIVAPPSRVRDALEIARLHEVLEVHGSMQEALKN